jgi:long-chain acyl-CoA synthetase
MNVAEYLLAGKNGTRIALRFPRTTCSYGELTAYAGSMASYLSQVGVRQGERILLIEDNSLFWVACYLGAMQAGCVVVPMAPSSSHADFKHVLETTEASIVCGQASVTAKHSSLLQGKHVVTNGDAAPIASVLSQRTFPTICTETSPEKSFVSVEDNDLAALVFTSGSTGRPHGVMVSHKNIIANTDSINSYLSLADNDRIMVVLPFHYCYGASLLHTHLRVGGEAVIENHFMYPEVVLQRLIDTSCTGFAGVPSHFQILLRNSTIKRKRFPDLRYVQQAGGHLAPTFVRELKEALPGTKIFIMYGQTEATARLSFLPPECLDEKLGSIGRGMPGVTLQVVNEAGHAVKPGEVGEIIAAGSNVTLGYWKASEETAATFKNGLLHTGDLARVDEDGYIFIVDRIKDFLKCRGEKISCRQLEETILECDELLEAAVVGIPDLVLGEAVKAFIVPRAHQDIAGLEERVTAFCKTRLAPHCVPKEIVVLRNLSKNSSGKIMKHALKKTEVDQLK